MPARETEPLVRAHIWLYARDWERVKELFDSTVGASKAVRAMVRTTLRQLEAKSSAQARSTITEQIHGDTNTDDILAGVDLTGVDQPTD